MVNIKFLILDINIELLVYLLYIIENVNR